MTQHLEEGLLGPEGEDWRVPVSELTARLDQLSKNLAAEGLDGALIQTPVDLYYYCGGRQNGTLFVPAYGTDASISGGGNGSVFFVRRSISRAKYEAGGDDSPIEIVSFPRMKAFGEELANRGVSKPLGLQKAEIPTNFSSRFEQAVAMFGSSSDISSVVHRQREIKSPWEIEMMKQGAIIQKEMFEAVKNTLKTGVTELDLVAAAESVSRGCGFGGNVQMRRYPLQCDRAVIVSGRAGGIPSFFDSAIGGTGPHPLSGMGSGFNKIAKNQPILVDLVHAHRGYVVDATRMFCIGNLDAVWHQRLEDMNLVNQKVVESLSNNEDCSVAWQKGHDLASELGYGDHLMGMNPDQSMFLGHSVGLQLDESPVVAKGFDRPMEAGMAMAIEPKVVYQDGSVGLEDTWIMTESGIERLTLDGWSPTIVSG